MTIYDHLGNEYPSVKEMCDHYGISQQTYNHRIKVGWTPSEALTVPVGEKLPQMRCQDHLGNSYSSIREMYEHYGLTENAYTWRKNRGWTLERILTTPLKKSTVTDGRGNEYKSVKDMCAQYGISVATYRGRRKRGWSLEEAVTGIRTAPKVWDHLGNPYPSLRRMCQAYQIDVGTYWGRRKNGWSLEDALTKPVQKRTRNESNGSQGD